MKCNICGNDIEGFGNNPFPLCDRDDNEARCCDVCNGYVINARIMKMRGKRRIFNDIQVGDTLIIFSSKESSSPILTLKEQGKFLGGVVEEIYNEDDKTILKGSWGNYIVTNGDNFSYLASN